MKKISSISFILLSFISFIVNWSFVENLLYRDSQLNMIEASGGDYVCSYYGEGDFDNDFFYMNKSLSVKNREQKIVAEVFMYKTDVTYTFEPFKAHSSLKNNEVAVSKNVASKYDFKVGDVLTVSSSLYGEPFQYCIKTIFEPAFCFTEEYFVADKGIILIANSPALIETNHTSVAFVDEQESLTNISLQKLTSLELYRNSLKQGIALNMGLVVGISCFVFVAYFILFSVASAYKIRKSVINGYSPKKLFLHYYFKPILWSIAYGLAITAFVFIESGILFGGFIVPVYLLWMLILPIVACGISCISLKLKMRRL